MTQVAVSKTGDPTGVYFLHDSVTPGINLNDYAELGVWPNGYYMTYNQFRNGGPFNVAGVYAFDCNKMLAGQRRSS